MGAKQNNFLITKFCVLISNQCVNTQVRGAAREHCDFDVPQTVPDGKLNMRWTPVGVIIDDGTSRYTK